MFESWHDPQLPKDGDSHDHDAALAGGSGSGGEWFAVP